MPHDVGSQKKATLVALEVGSSRTTAALIATTYDYHTATPRSSFWLRGYVASLITPFRGWPRRDPLSPNFETHGTQVRSCVSRLAPKSATAVFSLWAIDLGTADAPFPWSLSRTTFESATQGIDSTINRYRYIDTGFVYHIYLARGRRFCPGLLPVRQLS